MANVKKSTPLLRSGVTGPLAFLSLSCNLTGPWSKAPGPMIFWNGSMLVAAGLGHIGGTRWENAVI